MPVYTSAFSGYCSGKRYSKSVGKDLDRNVESGPYSTENPVDSQALVRQKSTDLLDRVDL